MKNPCKNCLVRSICTEDCSRLQDFIIKTEYKTNKIILFPNWLYIYELRPQILNIHRRIIEGLKIS